MPVALRFGPKNGGFGQNTGKGAAMSFMPFYYSKFRPSKTSIDEFSDLVLGLTFFLIMSPIDKPCTISLSSSATCKTYIFIQISIIVSLQQNLRGCFHIPFRSSTGTNNSRMDIIINLYTLCLHPIHKL